MMMTDLIQFDHKRINTYYSLQLLTKQVAQHRQIHPAVSYPFSILDQKGKISRILISCQDMRFHYRQ